MVAAAFAIIAATVQAISIAWEDRKSADFNTLMSDSVQEKRNSIRGLWNAIYAVLREFKYWFLEVSLHEPLKVPKESEQNHGANQSTTSYHRTFKEVQSSSSPCDKCRDLAKTVKYQCVDCDQGYCIACWPRTLKRGARLEDNDEQPWDPTYDSVELGNLKPPPHSATSSSNVSPRQTPTGYTPLQHIEEGNFSFSLNI